MPTSNPYNPHAYINSTGAAFEPFSVPSFPTTTSQSHDFSFAATSAPHTLKGNYHPQTPAESPTNSANNSFDIQPPHLSSTSDSGASVQSTSSSAMGSPSLNQGGYGHESWTTYGQGLGIVHHEHLGQEPFAASGLEYDPLLGHDKIPGCVGESPSISSTQRSLQPTSTSLSSFSSSQNQSQNSSNVFRIGQRPFPQRATSLDTSVAGHHSSHSAASSLQTPTSANPYPRHTQQPILQRANSSSHLTAGMSGFKSPSTPASATRPLATFSPPHGERRGSLLSNPVPTDNRFRSMSSPASGSPHRISTSLASPGISTISQGISTVSQGPSTASQSASPSHAPQSPFFSQSSGFFVAPLGLSCRFPYPCPISYLRIFWVFALPFLHRNQTLMELPLTVFVQQIHPSSNHMDSHNILAPCLTPNTPPCHLTFPVLTTTLHRQHHLKRH